MLISLPQITNSNCFYFSPAWIKNINNRNKIGKVLKVKLRMMQDLLTGKIRWFKFNKSNGYGKK